MKCGVYSIRDRKSGIYGSPFYAVNDDCAVRDFDRIATSEANAFIADDLELYKVGIFDNDTGNMECLDSLEYMKGGVKPIE